MGVRQMDLNKASSGLVLYHGSRGGIIGDLALKSAPTCDFGQGFYMSTSKEQAFSSCIWAENPRFYECTLDLSNLVVEFLSGKKWLFLVSYCHGKLEKFSGTDFYRSIDNFMGCSDMFVGNVLEPNVYPVFQDFMDGKATDQGLNLALSMTTFGQQFVLKSKVACSHVKLKEVFLSKEELEELYHFNERKTVLSSSVLQEVSRTMSRYGTTIDEYSDLGLLDTSFVML